MKEKEKEILNEILNKAVERGVISSLQKEFYLLRYLKGDIDLIGIQNEISKSPSTKIYKKQIWPYKFIKRLGRGGMGEVYSAVHRKTGKKVAIKKMKLYYIGDKESQEKARRRFIRECSLQSKLNHPNIVKVYDYGAYGNELFLATQLIEGDTLFNIVKQKKVLDTYYKEVVPYLLEKMEYICDAIEYAHSKNIIHRDINPKNIMIDYEGHIWIMDFGLAKTPDASKLTKSNEVIGTPTYMSPEQWRNENIGKWSDIYSLGATLFFVATGSHPHPEDIQAVAYNIANEIPPTSLRAYSEDLPEELDKIIHKAMSYNIRERYKSAKSLKNALHNCLEEWRQGKKSIFRKIIKLFKD